MMRYAVALKATIATIALVCAGGLPMARAQDASAWDGELHAAARLIAGAAVQSADARVVRAGIEIRLDPGWKTYWRYPGDSGVPPTLDFAGSENVKSVTALWPAPKRFADGAGGHSIGYLGDVVLPLRIIANDATKPSALHVKLGYAICGTLCVPAEADLDLVLSGKAGAEEPALVAAEARVPRRVPLGAGTGPGGGLAVRSFGRRPDARLGAAAARAERPGARQRAGNTAIHVRPRGSAARRKGRRRDFHFHRNFACRCYRGQSPSRLIRPAR
jgi:hypothetical protein